MNRKSNAKKRVSRPRPQRRVHMSKRDMLIAATIQDNTHASTTDVSRKRTLLVTEVGMADAEIVELTARLSVVRASKAAAEAKIDALSAVIGRRQICGS